MLGVEPESMGGTYWKRNCKKNWAGTANGPRHLKTLCANLNISN